MSKRTWNNRIIRYTTGEYGLHEVHYSDGVPEAMSEHASAVGTTVEELTASLEQQLRDVAKYKDDILDFGFWEKP